VFTTVMRTRAWGWVEFARRDFEVRWRKDRHSLLFFGLYAFQIAFLISDGVILLHHSIPVRTPS
jgi:hypothetical protein